MKNSGGSNVGTALVIAGVIGLVAAGALIGALLVSGGDDEEIAPIVVGSNTPAAVEAGAAGAPDPDDVPIAASEIQRIEAAALRVTGGGTVTEVDRSDDAGEAFEVEVVTDDGEVDVALDHNLTRVPNLRYDDLED